VRRGREIFLGTFVSSPLEENPDSLLRLFKKMSKEKKSIYISQNESFVDEM